ncbi:MAG: hypothetical protein HN736_09165 [Anaerolineae bacterium]|jgi:hypothetical protein|nr:hypothetical protein [Anaerolineae bacterium]MBT3712203.1 hypothetical protein [Anaerolineae bacterium]MBT4310224.1 hypothetical protein [Anaerolineae bacterium]MBT4460019.1 hypothetical protein [Anaerolineae bacterium]MBT4842196.1 hypothetical protein [Anaerolineae bacterium]
MSNKSMYKVGLTTAILSAFGWIAFILGSTGGPDYSTLSGLELFQAWNENRFGRLLYGWGGVFGALLSIPYFLSFHYALKETGSVRSVTTVAAVIGSVLAAFGFFKPLTMVYAWVPAALEASPDALPMIEIAANYASGLFEVPWWIGSFLAYSLGVGLFAYYAFRTDTGPKWLNIVGILGGITGIIWLRYFFPVLYNWEFIGSILNILMIFIWSIGLSASLLKTESNNK